MSVKVAGVTLKVTGADQFKTDLDQANNALKKYKEQSKLLDASNGDKNSSDYLSQKQQLLTQQADAAKQRVESLKAAREDYAGFRYPEQGSGERNAAEKPNGKKSQIRQAGHDF